MSISIPVRDAFGYLDGLLVFERAARASKAP